MTCDTQLKLFCSLVSNAVIYVDGFMHIIFARCLNLREHISEFSLIFITVEHDIMLINIMFIIFRSLRNFIVIYNFTLSD
jgi:hypothetical protein